MGAAPPDDEFPCGVVPLLPADPVDPVDDALDEADVLAFGVDDALVVALGELFAVGDVVDRTAFAAGELVQGPFGVGRLLATLAGLELRALLLGRGLGLGEDGGLVLTPGLGEDGGLVLTSGVGEDGGLVLTLGLAGGVVAGLDDVAGVLAFPGELLAGLVLVTVVDDCADRDAHALGVGEGVRPGTAGCEPSAVRGDGVLPWPSVVPAPLEVLLLVKA